MHRIDGPGSINGGFTEGNPNTGQRATKVSAAWLNDVQEQIAYVIEEQGIALSKGDASQLSDAIVALVSGAVGDGSGAVPTTRTLAVGGLVTGGGSLAVDRTFTVTKATPAEVAAGVRDDVAITPLGLLGGVGARLLQQNGYATMLGGVILQWGSATIAANSALTVTLPITFPVQCFFAGVDGGNPTANATENNTFVSGRSASTVTFFNAENGPQVINYLAIGA